MKSFTLSASLTYAFSCWTLAYGSKNQSCRALPHDRTWPSPKEWATLNQTVGGRLIATVPLASVCHDPAYDEAACNILKQNWLSPEPHLAVPAEILDPYFQTESCEPFTPRERPCTLGNYAVYSINVTDKIDISAGVIFAKTHNIRLTIKNTGHDLLGKSTGRGALSLWTHNLDTMEFFDTYSGDSNYNGSAVRIGAGVLASDLITAAARHRVRVVTGSFDTVGVAGGYTAGGGHGALTSLYGMAADSVLEWEVVIADGTHVIATPTHNADLYWALCGGGAGTFGVVVSMTTRTYSDGPMQNAGFAISLADNAFGGNANKFWEAIETFHSTLSPVVEAGGVLTWQLTESALQVFAIVLPGNDPGIIDEELDPMLAAMKSRTNLTLKVLSSSYESWYDLYRAVYQPVQVGSQNGQISGGRLIPRSVLQETTGVENVTHALRNAVEGGFLGLCGAIDANNTAATTPDNAVFPVWRDTLVHCIVIRTWNYSLPWDTNIAFQKNLTTTVMPAIELATPGGGSYLNEANFEQLDWQEVFYGTNYPRLQRVKAKYDPDSLFYARTAVGSEAWYEDGEHRLCRTGLT
ncbi:hypothetical protein F4808DRAFT_453069 [Astrocystis sublimbata]|nr:hypothetical protein F4808DRAFT_453069 [Astrocystis sublimbata]